MAITRVGRTPHFANPHPLQLLGFEDMILLRTGGLAASPPVRYTLETAEQFWRSSFIGCGGRYWDQMTLSQVHRAVAALVSPVSISHAAWDIHAVHGVHAMHSVKRLGTARFEPGAWGSLALGTPPPHRPARPAQPDTDEATDYLQRFVARGIVLTGTYVLKLRMSEGDLISGTLLSASSQPVDGQRSSAHGRSRHRAEGLPRT